MSTGKIPRFWGCAARTILLSDTVTRHNVRHVARCCIKDLRCERSGNAQSAASWEQVCIAPGMIKPEHIVAIDVEPAEVDCAQAGLLATHTANTWQPDRSPADRLRDTLIGKAAELAWLRYLQRESIACRLWDDMRRDGGRDHAPVDGFVAQRDAAELLAGDLFADTARQWQEGAHFRRGFFAACERRGIFGFEVKSTRIGPRHLAGGQVNYAAILEDDFLVYPPVRAGALDESTRQDLISQKQRAAAAERTPYLLARAYVEARDAGLRNAEASRAVYRVYLVGYMTRPHFFQSPRLRVTTMPQSNKSEQAIYYAVPLRLGQNLSGLRQTLGL